MEKQFEILKANRTIILNILDDLTLTQVNRIPDGFRNNIIWNAAHLIVTQQLLYYKLSGIAIGISDEMVFDYQKDTAPKKEITLKEFEIIKKQLINLVDTSKGDYTNGVFSNYAGYQPSTAKVYLKTIEDAIQFNNFHEGMHLGYILALKNVL